MFASRQLIIEILLLLAAVSAKTVCDCAWGTVCGEVYVDEELDVDVRLVALMRGTCKMLKNSIN